MYLRLLLWVLTLLLFASSTGAWTQVGSDLLGSINGAFFGISTALSADGTILAVGSTYDDGLYASQAGTVKIYLWDSSTSQWTQKGSTLEGNTELSEFGTSISLSYDGYTVAVGTPFCEDTYQYGCVRIFYWSDLINDWAERYSLTLYQGGDLFGNSVSLTSDGLTVAIGAPSYNTNYGSVSVYYYDASVPCWNPVGSIIVGTSGVNLGYTVSINADGTRLATGAHLYSSNSNSYSGKVIIYEYNGNDWSAIFTEEGDSSSNSFGQFVSMSGDGRVVTASAPNYGGANLGGYVRIYRRVQPTSGSSYWSGPCTTIMGDHANSNFGVGQSLSHDGSIFALGISLDNDGSNTNRGETRVYSLSFPDTESDTCSLSPQTVIYGTQDDEYCGRSTALTYDGSVVAFGCSFYTDYDNNLAGVGRVRAYTSVTAAPTATPTVAPTSSKPSQYPTFAPSLRPTSQPTGQPSRQPTRQPTSQPSRQPTRQPTSRPSSQPSGQPSSQPSSQPSRQPSAQPSCQPTRQPTGQPTSQPSRQPTSAPTRQPSTQPSSQPSRRPSSQPTRQPSGQPSAQPSKRPSSQPSARPTRQPSSQPSRQPTRQPTSKPSAQPTGQPSRQPSQRPTTQPSSCPSAQPSRQPSRQPAGNPTSRPSAQPSCQPSGQPSGQPSSQPSRQPTAQPSTQPSRQPSGQPSGQPSRQPTKTPSTQPSSQPSGQPTCRPSSRPSRQPSGQPSSRPSAQPSDQPSAQPSTQPSAQPSRQPTSQPSSQPTRQPSTQPSGQPSRQPSRSPSSQPSAQPSDQPTLRPSSQPTSQPSRQPSARPSTQPSRQPSAQPSGQPSGQPSRQPTAQPSSQPSTQPSFQPTNQPSVRPTGLPSTQPSVQPSRQPTGQPSTKPSSQPSRHPSTRPSSQPSLQPSAQPSTQPSTKPTGQPTAQPSAQPTRQPSYQPSNQPSVQPTRVPSTQPSCQPTRQPTSRPSRQPSNQPSNQPSSRPSSQPSVQPSLQPSAQPSTQPSRQPSSQPTAQPSRQPSRQPTVQPSGQPSRRPSSQPSEQPSRQPSHRPSRQPSSKPSCQPTSQPSRLPSCQPISAPSVQPSTLPTAQPSRQPSTQPARSPSLQPSSQPSAQPVGSPTGCPSNQPSSSPSTQPSTQPTSRPSGQPSFRPSSCPSAQPSSPPSSQSTSHPSDQPSSQPSSVPSTQPTCAPSALPSRQPSSRPSSLPTAQPSGSPSSQPTVQPSGAPTNQPSAKPSAISTAIPSTGPSSQPSPSPSSQPSVGPSSQPSCQPTKQPTQSPFVDPTTRPSSEPSRQPSSSPSSRSRLSFPPVTVPTVISSASPLSTSPTVPVVPSLVPTLLPSSSTSLSPTRFTTQSPASLLFPPSSQPSRQPTSQPSRQPFHQPTSSPTAHPKIVLSSKALNLTVARNTTVWVPPIVLPPAPNTYTSTTLQLALKVQNTSSKESTAVSVSVVQFNQAILAQNRTDDSLNIESVDSNVLNVQVTVSGGSLSGDRPTFIANMSLLRSAESLPGPGSAEWLRHNCTAGVAQSVLYHCQAADRWLNLTCLGAVSVSVAYECPVLQRVCNVLSLETATVTDRDYCVAEFTSAKYTICRCGLSDDNRRRLSSLRELGAGTSTDDDGTTGGGGKGPNSAQTSAVSVAVMSEFVASDFATTVSISPSLSGQQVSEQSTAIFAFFGAFWFVSLMAMALTIVLSWQKGKKVSPRWKWLKKQGDSHLTFIDHANANGGHSRDDSDIEEVGSRIGRIPQLVTEYISASIPFVLHQGTVLQKYWTSLCRGHIYVRTVLAVLRLDEEDLVQRQQHSPYRALVMVARLLTSIMISFFLLALFYDLQYPSNDGSCVLYRGREECLSRKSVLDVSRSYCDWVLVSPRRDSALVGLVQHLARDAVSGLFRRLEQVPVSTAPSPARFECQFNDADSSLLTGMIVAVLTSCFSVLLTRPLDMAFAVIDDVDDAQGTSVDAAVASVDTTKPSSAGGKEAQSGWMRYFKEQLGRLLSTNIFPHVPKHVLEARHRLLSQCRAKKEDASSSQGIEEEEAGASQPALQSSESPSASETVRAAQLVSASTTIENRENPKKEESQGRRASVLRTGGLSDFLSAEAATHQFTREWMSYYEGLQDTQQSESSAVSAAEFLSAWSPFWTDRSGAISSAVSFQRLLPVAARVHKLQQQYAQALSAQSAEEAEKGLLFLHLLLLDLLGYPGQRPAARLFEFFVRQEFSAERSVFTYRPRWLRVLLMLSIFALDMFAMYYITLRGVQQGAAWQRAYLLACMAQMLTESLLFLPFEILYMDVFLPSLIVREVAACREQLAGLWVAFLGSDGTKERHSEDQLDVTDYFFVSRSISKLVVCDTAEAELAGWYRTVWPEGVSCFAYQRLLRHQPTSHFNRKNQIAASEVSTANNTALSASPGRWQTLYQVCKDRAREVLLFLSANLPFEAQRVLVRFFEPFLFTVCYFIWILAAVHAWSMALLLLVLVGCAVWVMRSVWWRNRTPVAVQTGASPAVTVAHQPPLLSAGSNGLQSLVGDEEMGYLAESAGERPHPLPPMPAHSQSSSSAGSRPRTARIVEQKTTEPAPAATDSQANTREPVLAIMRVPIIVTPTSESPSSQPSRVSNEENSDTDSSLPSDFASYQSSTSSWNLTLSEEEDPISVEGDDEESEVDSELLDQLFDSASSYSEVDE